MYSLSGISRPVKMLPRKKKKKVHLLLRNNLIERDTGNDCVFQIGGALGYRSNPIAPHTPDRIIVDKSEQRRAGFKHQILCMIGCLLGDSISWISGTQDPTTRRYQGGTRVDNSLYRKITVYVGP